MRYRNNVFICNRPIPFENRVTVGQALGDVVAQHVENKGIEEPVVLGLPRGGMVVAAQVSERLLAPMNFMVTRKLHAPFRRDLVIGAVTESGRSFLNKPVIDALNVSDEYIQSEIAREQSEIQASTAAYRSILPALDIHGRNVILVDDNVITGSTMFASLRALWAEHPKNVIVAAPVASRDVLLALSEFADNVLALHATSKPIENMEHFYEEFGTVTDDQVIDLLHSLVTV